MRFTPSFIGPSVLLGSVKITSSFKFDGPAILIHGGAGGIERKYYTDEQIAAVRLRLAGGAARSGYALLA